MPESRTRVLIGGEPGGWEQERESLFAPQGLEVALAYLGEEVLETYLRSRPDILILDMEFAYSFGLEVMDYIRGTLEDSDLYILALTGESEEASSSEALRRGANDILLRPFSRQELWARLSMARRQQRLNRQLRSAYRRITGEISTVASLQYSLLPKGEIRTPEVFAQGVYRPSGHASGDYYDYFFLDNHLLRVVMADVSGHGARAAFLMAVVRAITRTSEHHEMELDETVRLVNSQLCEIIGRERDFVAMFCADLEVRKKRLRYINAGLPPGMLFGPAGGERLLYPTHTILGFFDLEFAGQEVDLSPYQGLCLFTDGYYEWEQAPGRIYGLQNFLDLLREVLPGQDFTLDCLERELGLERGLSPSSRDDRSAVLVRW